MAHRQKWLVVVGGGDGCPELAVGFIERDLGGRPVELTVCGSLVLILDDRPRLALPWWVDLSTVKSRPPPAPLLNQLEGVVLLLPTLLSILISETFDPRSVLKY
jgi:hypothetical protein